MWFHFFFTLQVDTVYQNFLATHACLCFYVMEFRKQKNTLCKSEASLCFTQENILCIMNKIELVSQNISLNIHLVWVRHDSFYYAIPVNLRIKQCCIKVFLLFPRNVFLIHKNLVLDVSVTLCFQKMFASACKTFFLSHCAIFRKNTCIGIGSS